MAEIHCTRCGSDAESLDRPPLPGEPGGKVQAHTCAKCWQEWTQAQVMVINEYQLSPADPKHYDFLLEQMGTFLNLPKE